MKRAFTIVELLIYMGVIATLFTVLGTILVSTLDLQVESQSASQVEADARFILARLAYDLHRADDLITPANTGQSAPTLSVSASGDTLTYTVSASALQLTSGVGTASLTSSGTAVLDFSVTRLANPGAGQYPTAKIDFTLSASGENRSYTTTLGLRN